jgi:signal peptidase I
MDLSPRKLIADNKTFLLFVAGMILMRSALADWYVVPSSSMYPHLLEGDRVISNRIAYDIKVPFTDVILKQVGAPERGDIVTFSSPADGVRLIKRVIGLPGDVVEMRDQKLIINGQAADYAHIEEPDPSFLTPTREYPNQQLMYTESLGNLHHNIITMPERSALRSFDAVTVPAGHYMMLGDNRDNSNDSRFYGFVKRELITGRVKRLMFSLDYDNYYLPRVERIGAKLDQ